MSVYPLVLLEWDFISLRCVVCFAVLRVHIYGCTYMSIYLFIYLSTSADSRCRIHTHIYLHICVFVSLFIYLSIPPSIQSLIYPSIHLNTRLFPHFTLNSLPSLQILLSLSLFPSPFLPSAATSLSPRPLCSQISQ